MEDITEGAGWQGAGVRGLWRDLARTATRRRYHFLKEDVCVLRGV